MNRLAALVVAGVAAVSGAFLMVFLYAPVDAIQGPVQKIFYVHVGSILGAYACFALVLGGSVAYLRSGSARGDRLARSAAPAGLVLTWLTIGLGIIWAKPAWNWDPGQTWDARFTSTVVLGCTYGGYLLVRRFAPPGRTAARLAAVVGLVGFVDVPVVHFSVQWWRTLHPGPVVERNQLPPAMLLTFAVTVAALLLLTSAMVALRYRVEALRDAEPEALGLGERVTSP